VSSSIDQRALELHLDGMPLADALLEAELEALEDGEDLEDDDDQEDDVDEDLDETAIAGDEDLDELEDDEDEEESPWEG